MEYCNLGNCGVKVSRLCLGTMNFGKWTSEKDAIAIIHRALDEGINFIDTANIYSGEPGTAERYIGKALSGGLRNQVVLATKVRGQMGPGPNDYGRSRYHIMQQVEASLKRLNTDHIDLYQLHSPQDIDTPMEETLRAFDDLVRQGKILYFGTSRFAGWQLCEALWICDKLNLHPLVSEQPRYNIFRREVENEVIPFCRKYGLGVIPFSPLSGGWLAGRYKKGEPVPEVARARWWKFDFESPEALKRFEIVEKLKSFAQELGVTLSQFSLAWVLAQPGVTAPIIGPRIMEHLEDNLGALKVQLSPEILKKVDELVAPGTNV
ncbi:aldo/keto reductase [candidate division KSB1 bacterium]|nr:MAG: aldo/keto reductase [candidate division KSB1 bacterium]RKY80708.1 MAG: aldo/keto reductase [candidate division KSB1 bacterium]RKY84977.1 MAG: aldo/keto reductase [candidate division KSB1 bacterium]RKY87739.1 MAG: aldo/keto reductase [candidate division KSB1 bacterium]